MSQPTGAKCTAGKTIFRTYEVAQAFVATHKDLDHAYHGSCCGHWHVTRSEAGEHGQRAAEYRGSAQTRPRYDVIAAFQRIANAPRK